jgi:indolepyruvate ferredoxin oxidoreductase
MLTESDLLVGSGADKHRTFRRDFTLDDKFTREEGYIILSGVHALVRLALDQHRADRRQGLNTAMLISGYRGSPLGGLDMTLQQNDTLLSSHQIKFIPGVNEELGATAVFGSQIANMLPNPRHDGVLGMWYGKAPGVDRSGDVFKHANYAGVGRHGGVLAVAGDDPYSKSSTLPSASEGAFYDALFPVIYPGSVQEVLDYGRLGFELSRYSGLWVGFKIVTNIADEFSMAEVSPERLILEDPGFEYRGKPWRHSQNTNLLTPFSLTMEREIHEGRLEAARRFASTNALNCITVPTADAWLGIVAAGKTYYDVRQALLELGLSDADLHRYGIRLLKLGMTYPIEPAIVREFADGLEEILVIEEKRAFIELFLQDILYHVVDRPRIIGKRDETDQPLIAPHGELDSDKIVPILVKRLTRRLPLTALNNRLDVLNRPPEMDMIPLLPRSPYYCSGCPHNSSTVAPQGSLVGAGIGCHTMALLMDKEEIIGITQMGGEGVQWVGASPFSDTPHIFQNLGDGTLFHSGSLAIRQSIAAGANITYKILYNSAVAMTGGQDADGAMPIPELTRALKAEGVGRIIITTDDTSRYDRKVRLPKGVEVWHRDRLDEAQRALRETPGVTILIHDQECAAELRRKRKRGLAPEPATRVFINEAVCEGCGDCGVKSNCLSVFPVETEFGRKTQIHQSSCNKDYSCLKGDCPAFMTIEPEENRKKPVPKMVEIDDSVLPQPPVIDFGQEYSLFMMGIGGTGVVTTNQILAIAGMIDGKFVRALDQTGLSQKGGPVVSNLKIYQDYAEAANKVSAAAADCYLVFDLLTATEGANLSRANRDKTSAVVSTSKVPTGSMIKSTEVLFPAEDRLITSIERSTQRENNFYFDANMMAEVLFGNHMMSNLIVVGAAYQRGLIPLSAAAIERAIELNGTAVRANIQAFRAGRRAVAEPEWIDTLKWKRPGSIDLPQAELSPAARSLVESVGADGELLRLLEIRVPELIAYQNSAYARQYIQFVRDVYEAEQRLTPGQTRLSEAVARYLFKLMAYKDEYEVARLSLKPEVRAEVMDEFGAKARASYLLHPPLLRALGLKNKIRLGRWFDHAYRLLVAVRGLRGTPLDMFGYAKVRRVERALIGQYRALIEDAIRDLTPANHDRAVELANLPDIIRGYEDIKLRNVEKFWSEVKRLGFHAQN